MIHRVAVGAVSGHFDVGDAHAAGHAISGTRNPRKPTSKMEEIIRTADLLMKQK